ALAADRLRVRADGAAQHRPGDAPAQRRVPGQEDRHGDGADRSAAQEENAAGGGSGRIVPGDALAAAAAGGGGAGAVLDRPGGDSARGGAGPVVGAAELAGVP